MTWTKLSDDFSDDTWTLSDAAYRLHTDGLIWSNRKGLDLRIPPEDLTRASKRADAIQELLDGGWWRVEDGAYFIVHHGLYQRPRAAVIAQQEANRRNGAKGGRPLRDTHSVSNSVSESVSDSPSESETERDRTGLALSSRRNSAGTRDLPPAECVPPGDNVRSPDPPCARIGERDRLHRVPATGGVRPATLPET